jgi:hypothetical protein
MPVLHSLEYSTDVGYSVSDTYYTGFAHTDVLVADSECIQSHTMSNMNLDAFNKFFGLSSDDRASIMDEMSNKFLDTVTNTNGQNFTESLISDYNTKKGLSGKYQIDSIAMSKTNTVMLFEFDTALNTVTVPSSMFVATVENASELNQLQIVFKFVCNDVTSKVSFKWNMV